MLVSFLWIRGGNGGVGVCQVWWSVAVGWCGGMVVRMGLLWAQANTVGMSGPRHVIPQAQCSVSMQWSVSEHSMHSHCS